MQDVLVKGREGILAVVLGFDSSEVLNGVTGDFNPSINNNPLAAELKMAMNTFRSLAMDEGGDHVNYAAISESDAYAMYTTECSPSLNTFNPAVLTTREEQLAFWINLYNALIIDAVIRFGVSSSVTEGPVGILKFFRRAAYRVCGMRMSPEDIEQGVLRRNRGNPYLPGPQFGLNDLRLNWVVQPQDPRIHFALNCASCSCPPVGVYTPENIDFQLDLAARNFIQNDVDIISEKKSVSLSKIFLWYKIDFGGQEGVVDFLLKYLPEKERAWLSDNRDEVRWVYKPYDWSLNI